MVGVSICLVEQTVRRRQDGKTPNADVDVEVVVGHVHPVGPWQRSGPIGWRPLGCAGEGGVSGGEGCLPHLAELVEEPGNGGLVSLVVEHHDDAFVGEDHFGQSGPVIEAHRHLWRSVEVIDQARVLDWSGVVAGLDEVGVD